jgi:chromosome segregation ATPase
MPPIETPCTEHEQQIQDLSRKTAELETRADYKDRRIDELNNKMDKIENKLDNLTDTVNNVVVNSIKDDNDLKKDVIELKTRLDTQDEVIKQYKEESRKQREEDRSKLNTRLTLVSIGLAAFALILTHFF